jgi:thymidylate kinase
MKHSLPGRHVWIDGMDGVGKGQGIIGIVEHLRGKSVRVVDMDNFGRERGLFPDFDNPTIKKQPNPYFLDPGSLDVFVGSEPTYFGAGLTIRNEIIQSNGRVYPAEETAQWYSMDRLVWYRRVVLPALRKGLTVIQSRGLITTMVYQPIQARDQKEEDLPLDRILEMPGNVLAEANLPDLIIIPTVDDPAEVMRRIALREKKDGVDFENVEFQRQVKAGFENELLRGFFESRGTSVAYVDAGESIEATRANTVEAYLEQFA